jgi:hypothetical protein
MDVRQVDMDVRIERSESAWRWKSRPMMVAILLVLTTFFFSATFYQLQNLNHRIEGGPRVEANALLANADCPDGRFSPGCLAMTRMNRAVLFEAYLIARRHHQADVMLMASIWSRYLGFITGMTLALVGAAFTLGQLRDRGTTIEAAAASTAKATLTSASPGIVMAGLGVALMVTTILTVHQLSTRDAAVYFVGDVPLQRTTGSIYVEPGAEDEDVRKEDPTK